MAIFMLLTRSSLDLNEREGAKVSFGFEIFDPRTILGLISGDFLWVKDFGEDFVGGDKKKCNPGFSF